MAGEYSLNQQQVYAAKAVFVSSGSADSDQTISGSIRQLSRIQSVNWDLGFPLEQPTYIDAGTESYYPYPPDLQLTFAWFHSNGRNEQALGLLDTVGTAGALALNLDQEKALYVGIQNTPGRDAIGAPQSSSQTVLGFAQGLMTNYSLSAAVGGLIQAQATMSCLTAFIYSGASGEAVAAVNPVNGVQLTGQFVLPPAFPQYDPDVTGVQEILNTPVAAIAARDMFLLFPSGLPFGVTMNGPEACYLQSFQAGFNIRRSANRDMGEEFPATRGVLYPIEINLSTEALVNRYQRDQLERLSCLQTGFTVNVVVKQPCSNAVLFYLNLNNLQLASQSFNTSIGPMDSVSLRWRGLITSPSTIFFNPGVSFLYNEATTGAWGTTW